MMVFLWRIDKETFFLPYDSLSSTVFVLENRGDSEGFSVELARDSTWWGKGKWIVQD
jgi:hypothetical protein